MLSPELIQLLRCLHTGSCLRLADQAVLDRLNRAIAQGRLKNKRGELVTEPLHAALISEAADVAYAVIDEIPVLLRDEAIEVRPRVDQHDVTGGAGDG